MGEWKNNRIRNVMTACAVVAFALIVVSCGGKSERRVERNHHIDSVANEVSSIDSLNRMLIDAERNGDREAQMLIYKHLGKRYRNSSMFEDAIKSHTRGFELACALGDTVEIIRALNNLGTSFRRIGIMEEATSYHYRALSYCEQYSDKTSWDARKNRVISLNGIGNIYLTVGDYNAADTVLRQALAGEAALESDLGQAINYSNLGAIMEHRNEIDSAWHYYRKSLELNEKVGSQLGVSLNHTSFGDLYIKEGDYDKAVGEYRVAYDLMKQGNDRWHWLNACEALARVYLDKNDLSQASHYINEADDIARQINSIGHIADVYNLKYRLASKRGDNVSALSNYIKYNQYQDSISNEENRNQLQNMRVKLERDRRQAEIDLVNKNYITQKKLKNLFIALLVAVLMLAAVAISFLLYSLRMRARNQRLMRNLEKTRTDFFTNITHEFRTPLTVILGLAEQLHDEEKQPAELVKKRASIISRQGNNLLQLINQLLDISKVKSAIGNPEWKKGDVVAYTSMIVESYQELCSQKRIEMRYVSAQQSIVMDFVPYYMRRIVHNLISNAIKFTPEYGKIYITTKVEDNKLVLTVADTGKGIAKDDLPHIFDAFYQGKAVSDGNMGTGVGLSLVYQIVKVLKGSIAVQSGEGDGSIFTITLPVEKTEDNVPEIDMLNTGATDVEPAALVEARVDDDADESSTLPRVLVIEDHSDVSYYIGSLLEQDYSLYFARNGKEGLDKAKEIMPELIITDLMMPEMDGLELCRRIRSSELLNHIPIIVVTAKTSEQDRITGIEAGADAYLNKPFNRDEIKMLATKLIEQRHVLRAKFSQVATPIADGQKMADSDRQFINRLVDIVYSNMKSGEIDIESVASTMAMTPSQLRRKVHTITGVNPAAYITEVRMTKARKLLDSDPNMAIGEIAIECGFYDIAHFSRIFKHMFGMSPSQYRRQPR